MAPPPVTGVSENPNQCVPGTDGCSNEASLLNKGGRQVGVPVVWTFSGLSEAKGELDFFKSEFVKNPHDPKFGRAGTVLRRVSWLVYDPKSRLARFVEDNTQGAFQPLSNTENRQALRRSGNRWKMSGVALDAVAQSVALVANLGALESCSSKGCPDLEHVAILSDTVASGSETASKSLLAGAVLLQSLRSDSRWANLLARSAHGLTLGLGGISLIISGGARGYAEWDHFTGAEDLNPSAFKKDVSDATYGAYQLAQSGYLLSATRGVGNVAESTSILTMKNLHYGARASKLLLIPGLVGGLSCLAIDGYSIIEKGVLDDDLTEEQRERNRHSGYIGLAGDIFSLASFLLFFGPEAPVSIPLFIIGNGFNIWQFWYDHADEIGEDYATYQKEGMAKEASLSFAEALEQASPWEEIQQDLRVEPEPLKSGDCKELLPTGRPLEFVCLNEDSLYFEAPAEPTMILVFLMDEGLEGPAFDEDDLPQEFPVLVTVEN